MYPVLIVLGAIIFLRFIPILKEIGGGTRVLICAMLVLLGGIMWEQAMYGYGRFTGHYISIATDPALVAVGKVTYMAGMIYMLYAFWMLAPARPRLTVPLGMAVMLWAMLTAALMF
tara:strand:+ start:434 stop:781 length:348 start_codon:yes stop_codon:yes gene_type:complete